MRRRLQQVGIVLCDMAFRVTDVCVQQDKADAIDDVAPELLGPLPSFLNEGCLDGTVFQVLASPGLLVVNCVGPDEYQRRTKVMLQKCANTHYLTDAC
jgi:hypothetical protein